MAGGVKEGRGRDERRKEGEDGIGHAAYAIASFAGLLYTYWCQL